MRLIDADALQEWVKKHTSVFARYDWRDILQMMRNAPTVDAVPVVRCKDCKWYISGRTQCEVHDACGYKLDDFCSYGERRQ